PANRYERQRVIVWAQATKIALAAFVDRQELVGWATSLRDGSPVEGAKLKIEPARGSGAGPVAQAISGANGLARIPLPVTGVRLPKMLVARKGADVAFLPENSYWWTDSSGWYRRNEPDALRWFVFDDRKMYR